MGDQQYDAIVVGAGPGGCACAALLQKRGMKVLLLEKNDRVGGKALNMHRDGFTYELWPVTSVPRYNTQFEVVLKEVGAEAPMSDVFPTTGSMVNLMSGNFTPKDGGFLYKPKGATDYVSYILVPPLMIPQMLVQDPDNLEKVNKLFNDMNSMSEEKLNSLDNVTFHDFIVSYDIPQSAYSNLAILCNAFFVVPVDLCSASEMIKTLRQFTAGLGSGYFLGGYAKLSESLVGALQSHGGDLKLKSRAEKIIVEGNQVRGVRTDKGTFHAPIVISNAGIQPTVLKLVGEKYFDKEYSNRIRGLLPSLALIGSRYFLNDIVFEDSLYAIYSDSSWWNNERYLRAKAGNIPDDIFVVITVPANFDPSLAPKGQQMIQTATICPADPKIKNMKARLEALDCRVAAFRPAIREHTIRREDYTTADVSRLTRDSVLPGQGGECVGLGQVVGQCGRNKPSPRAPIKGLFYVGTDAGGVGVGTHQAVDSAYKVARMVLEEKSG